MANLSRLMRGLLVPSLLLLTRSVSSLRVLKNSMAPSFLVTRERRVVSSTALRSSVLLHLMVCDQVL